MKYRLLQDFNKQKAGAIFDDEKPIDWDHSFFLSNIKDRSWFEPIEEPREIKPLSTNIHDYRDERASEGHRALPTTDNVDNLWWRSNKTTDKLNEVIEVLNTLIRSNS